MWRRADRDICASLEHFPYIYGPHSRAVDKETPVPGKKIPLVRAGVLVSPPFGDVMVQENATAGFHGAYHMFDCSQGVFGVIDAVPRVNQIKRRNWDDTAQIFGVTEFRAARRRNSMLGEKPIVFSGIRVDGRDAYVSARPVISQNRHGPGAYI
jgi:hypothetical protein